MYMYNSLQHTPVRHQPGFLGKLPRQTKKLKTSYKEDTHRDSNGQGTTCNFCHHV